MRLRLLHYRKSIKAALALLIGLLAAVPAGAVEKVPLHALQAETAPGTGPGVDLGNYSTVTFFARVTATSGTVTTFDLWTECSADNANWAECAVDDRVKATSTGAGPHTDSTIKLIFETTGVSAVVYAARLTMFPQFVRARWNIVGTTPSETFELVMSLK